MSNEKICFRIMVPIYKVESYLEECIESVLSQTYKNFELILLDDGSPDRCGEICDAYAAKDSRITVVHKPNEGLMKTRRVGIQAARKDGYAIFLDGDDSLQPHALQTIVEKIDQYGCDCVIYGANYVREGKVIHQTTALPWKEQLVIDKREIMNTVLHKSIRAIWRKCVKIELLSGWDFSPFYHLSIGEDRLQSLEIYENVQSVCFVNEALYNYRINPASMTQETRYEDYARKWLDFTIPEEECRFLQKIDVFTGEDFARYQERCAEDIAMIAVGIATLKTTYVNKLALFKKIKTTTYWKEFLSGTHSKNLSNKKLALILRAFQCGSYGLIILISFAYSTFRRIVA